jgi:pilus assembly protein Flp/PilA
MKKFVNVLYRLKIWRDTRGQDLIEYALIAGFIAVAAAAVMPQITNSLSNVFSAIGSKLDSAAGNMN